MGNAVFEMVKYHNQEYPQGIPLHYEEIAAHFDVSSITPQMPYSLHTEYSYGKRNLTSNLLTGLDELKNSNKNGIPQLWKSKKWSSEFAEYIVRLANGFDFPRIIEIHPSFSDYTENLNVFVERYKMFEARITNTFPKTEILIENRCGSVYQGGKFILSKMDSILSLSQLIDEYKLKLRFALDFPQLFTAHDISLKNSDKYSELVNELKTIRHNIAGVHLWGKRKSDTGRKVAHCGDLNSYFEYDDKSKNEFLESFIELFNDNVVRKLVLEVNSSNDDLLSIIADLQNRNIQLVKSS